MNKPVKTKKKVKNCSKAKTSNSDAIDSKPCDLKTLTLIDVTCPVCLSVMIEPVSMPCHHALCLPCFQLNVSESNLCCPLCRKRISVWVRKKCKTNDLVDQALWKKIQESFEEEVQARLTGRDDLNNTFTSTLPPRKVCAPGEIKEEFEEQMRRLREEEQRKRLEEEKASETILSKLLNEEKEREEQNLRTTEDDFEFAKQLRSSQIKETLNHRKTPNHKSPRPSTSSNSLRITHKSPVGPMDAFIAESNRRCSGLKFDNFLTGNREGKDSPYVDPMAASFPSSSSGSSSSTRLLKDITAQHSSESEGEFDSEENIVRPRKISKLRTSDKENKNNKRKFSCEPDHDVGKDAELLAAKSELSTVLSKVFDKTEMDEESLKELMEEQRLLEKRLAQEKEDRLFAMKLQKSMKEIDRTKGSEDEYCLRKKREASKRPRQSPPEMIHLGSSSSPSSSGSPVASECKYRQTTLLESISKKQRRL